MRDRQLLPGRGTEAREKGALGFREEKDPLVCVIIIIIIIMIIEGKNGSVAIESESVVRAVGLISVRDLICLRYDTSGGI